MANVSSEPGSSGKSLDVDLNLVPFIDLLSTLVLFLLLTVVWVQIGALPAVLESKGQSSVSQVDQSKLIVMMSAKSIRLTWPTKSAGRYPNSVENLDRLAQILQVLVKDGKAPAATIAGDDSVTYGAIIHGLDTLKSAGLTNVGLSTD